MVETTNILAKSEKVARGDHSSCSVTKNCPSGSENASQSEIARGDNPHRACSPTKAADANSTLRPPVLEWCGKSESDLRSAISIQAAPFPPLLSFPLCHIESNSTYRPSFFINQNLLSHRVDQPRWLFIIGTRTRSTDLLLSLASSLQPREAPLLGTPTPHFCERFRNLVVLNPFSTRRPFYRHLPIVLARLVLRALYA